MEMIWPHGDYFWKTDQEECEFLFPPKFLQEHSYQIARNFVAIPDGLHCHGCNNFHGYPSHELTLKKCCNFLYLLRKCPNCSWAITEGPRKYLLSKHVDYMNNHFERLHKKFDSIHELLTRCSCTNEKSLKLVREVDTVKDLVTAGPVLEMLMKFPQGILEDYKTSFHRFLKKLYTRSIGFVKGKYLVISAELLLRRCFGDKTKFLKVLSKAYALVESRYCSITRLAIEGGFWQVCPELGGFFWRNNNLEKEFPFLRKFLQNKTVEVKNFSLSMGPYYLIGGGYFSYISNLEGDIIIWYVPNFWQEAFTQYEKACYYNAQNFWYGWYGRDMKPRYGFPYNGVTINECDHDMLHFFPAAIANYHTPSFRIYS